MATVLAFKAMASNCEAMVLGGGTGWFSLDQERRCHDMWLVGGPSGRRCLDPRRQKPEIRYLCIYIATITFRTWILSRQSAIELLSPATLLPVCSAMLLTMRVQRVAPLSRHIRTFCSQRATMSPLRVGFVPGT